MEKGRAGWLLGVKVGVDRSKVSHSYGPEESEARYGGGADLGWGGGGVSRIEFF